jgi:multidrug efflux pump
MNLSTLAINRPVLAWVVTVVIILLGLTGFSNLQVREFPDVDIPFVTVTVIWPGAAPDLIETEVVDLIEEEVNTIEGIKSLRSQSQEQSALILVEFVLERDIDVAAQDVRDAVARVRNRLPRDVQEPVVQKFDIGAQPIMWLALSSEWMNPVQLTDFAERRLKDRLQVIPGVGRIQIGGEQRFAVRIDLDADQMAGRGLTVADISVAMRRENVEFPSGRLEGPQREIVVRTQARFPTPESLADLVITYANGSPIYLRDVATVRRGVENDRTLARFNGQSALGLAILPQSQANLLDVARGVKAEMETIIPTLPPGVALEIAFDVSRFIEASVQDTLRTLVLAGILVTLVIFFFLRTIRTSLIPAVVIPVAVIGTFGTMSFLDFSVNQITLLALILAIGLLVDDAIVMLENIYRNMEENKLSRREAALRGSKEITFAVISSSIALLAIFLPVSFITGIIGEFMFEFGVTVAIAVAISTLAALTLTPMLASRLLKVSDPGSISRTIERFFLLITSLYQKTLRTSLKMRWLVVFASLLVFFSSFFVLQQLEQEFQPSQDQSTIVLFGEAPQGSTLDYTDAYLRDLEGIILDLPERQTLFTALGFGQGGPGQPSRIIGFASLTDRADRDRSQFEIMADLRRQADEIPGLQILLQERNPFGGGADGRPFQIYVLHPDLEVLAETANTIVRRLRDTPGFVDIDSDLELNRHEIGITVNRELAASLGISASDIGETLQIKLGGLDLSNYQEDGRQYDVIVQLVAGERSNPDDLNRIFLRSRTGEMVPLSQLITITEGVGATQINHFNRQRAVLIAANTDGIALGAAIERGMAIAREIIPADATLVLTGEAADLEESFQALFFTFFLAVALVYLVLAAQFESWIHPFTILVGLPLSFVGAFGGLWIAGQTLNIFSFIGVILLIGLITKNGILLIDCIKQNLATMPDRKEAVIEAGRMRFRPIIMTAATTIFSVLPLALALGTGAESRAPLGTVVIGGLLVSTFLTLIVIPVVYTILDDLKLKTQKLTHRLARKPVPETIA